MRMRASLTALSTAFWLPYAAAAEIALEFRGEVMLPANLTADGYRFGGISGMAYDAGSDLYYAIGDDLENARFHTLRIDISDGQLDPGDVTVLSSVLLNDIDQRPFAGGALDPEGIALLADGTPLIAAETVGTAFPAFIRTFSMDGAHLSALPLDHKRYDPRFDAARGSRPSGGFESLSLTPDKATLFAAFEKPLRQDMADYDVQTPSPVRILEFDPARGEKTAEYVYMVGTMTITPEPEDGWYGRGLNDLLALGGGRLLAVERQYAEGTTAGTGSRPVEVFEVRLAGATDVSGKDALDGSETPASKRLVLDMERLRVEHGLDRIGSHEVLLRGPDLPDGSPSLIMMEDNDFERPTQVLLFALKL